MMNPYTFLISPSLRNVANLSASASAAFFAVRFRNRRKERFLANAADFLLLNFLFGVPFPPFFEAFEFSFFEFFKFFERFPLVLLRSDEPLSPAFVDLRFARFVFFFLCFFSSLG